MSRKPPAPNKRILSRTPVELHIASRVRELRTLAGISQMALAESLDFTVTQIQNYESGRAGIPSHRLWQIAKGLNVPVAWFFTSEPVPSDWMTPHEIKLIMKLRTLPGYQVEALLRSLALPNAGDPDEPEAQARSLLDPQKT